MRQRRRLHCTTRKRTQRGSRRYVTMGPVSRRLKPPLENEELVETVRTDGKPWRRLWRVAGRRDPPVWWKLRPARQRVVPDVVGMQVGAYAKRIQPQDRQLVVVEPEAFFNVETGDEAVIAHGTQWWYPRTPLQCKVANRSKVQLTRKQGGTRRGSGLRH